MTNNISDYFNNGSVFITGHVNPDGDALGAALSFKLILDELGFDSDVCFDINGKVPSSLDHLPLNLISQNPKDNYDKLIVFDCGNPQRLGELEILSDTASEVVVVDHHIDPPSWRLTIRMVDDDRHHDRGPS